MSERLAIGAVALLAAAVAIKKGSRSIDPSLSSWMDGFFRRHPKLSKYRRQIRFRERDSGGSAGHGEAQQHGDEVWVFPKFWGHPLGVQDFVMAHEIGHWVKSTHAFGSDFMDAARSVGVDPWDTLNLPFGQFNMEEAFADSFASYYTDGDVKRRYPAWTQLVEVVQSRRGSPNKHFTVTSPAQGLKAIEHQVFRSNHQKSLKVKPSSSTAVLIPCASTKPFTEAPSHKHGYLPALQGLDVDTYVVAEPLGVVPQAWSEQYPNYAYDFPPSLLKGQARAVLVERIAEWMEKVGSKYDRIVAALPQHHMKLVSDANKTVGLELADASIGACRDSVCSQRSFRATSPQYRKWLRRIVQTRGSAAVGTFGQGSHPVAEAQKRSRTGRRRALTTLPVGKVSYRVGGGGYSDEALAVSLYVNYKRQHGRGSHKVGEIVGVKSSPGLLDHCPEIEILLDTYPQTMNRYGQYANVLEVVNAFLNEGFRGKGLGIPMYVALIAEWYDKFGPFILAPNECGIRGGTSRDARRVWKSLTRIYPHQGRAVAVLSRPELPMGSRATAQTHAMKLPAWTLRLESGTKALKRATKRGDLEQIVAGLEDVSFWVGRSVGDAFGASGKGGASERQLRRAGKAIVQAQAAIFDAHGHIQRGSKNLVHQVQGALTPELLHPEHQGGKGPLAGHCYVATQALWHLMGGAQSGYTPHSGPAPGNDTHWWLVQQQTGHVLDPTASQFPSYDYSKGTGRGFLTKDPSQRARVVMDRVRSGNR